MRYGARYFLALVGLGATAQTSAGASFILCEAPDKADIIVELGARDFDGVELSCLSGGDFIVDMTPCAPEGGFGLSAPTGSASLIGIAHRWQDYTDHSGGVVGFYSTPSAYRFNGGFAFPGSGYTEAWSFEISRLTGVGDLSVVQDVEEGGEVGRSQDRYTCAPAAVQF